MSFRRFVLRRSGIVADTYRRAQKLARRLDAPLAQFAASAGLLLFHLMRAELNAAAALAAELTAAAPSLPLPECAAAAQAMTGAVLFSRGDLLGARRNLEGLDGLFRRRDANSPLDAAVWYLALLSMVHAGLGEVEAARAICADLLATAAGGGPFDIASGHMLVAGIEAQLHNAPLVLEHAQTAAAIAAEYDSPVLVSAVGQLRGWAMARLGDAAGGMTVLNEGETAWRASGQRLGLPFFAMLRAEACLCAGDRAGAEAAIAAGLEHARATGEHRNDTDLHRLRAECFRRMGRTDEATAALDAALRMAADQGARLAELRAAIECVRINQKNGRRRSAGERLAAIAASFDDGARLSELSIANTFLRDAGVT